MLKAFGARRAVISSRRPAEEYTMGMILRLIEGSLVPVACMDDEPNQCPRCETCVTLDVWKQIDDAVSSVVDHITLADLVKKQCHKNVPAEPEFAVFKIRINRSHIMSENVMTAMSGGVDSSVAAPCSMEQGFDVCGATLKLFSNDDIGLDRANKTCCSLTDVEDARSVCYKLNIDHFVFNFGDEFKRDVIRRFADAYIAGHTPNPCIDCNRFIKFDKLLERALLLDMDYIATGHYARAAFDDKTGRYLLKKAKDTSKDQTYVLYMLTQEQLKRTLFPLGGLTKSEVRALAEARGLVNAKKPDSQDICFVPDGDYAAFFENVHGDQKCAG